MTYRSSSALTGNTRTTSAVPVPAGAAAADIGLVGLFSQIASAITPPAGFTIIYDSGLVASIRLVVAWKRLSAGDTGTWDFTHASTYTRAAAGLWSGRVATGSPFTDSDGAIAPSGQLSIDVPSLDAIAGDDLAGTATSFNDTSWTPPAGMTERQDTAEGITLASRDAMTAGATGTLTFTASSSSGIAGWVGALAAALPGPAFDAAAFDAAAFFTPTTGTDNPRSTTDTAAPTDTSAQRLSAPRSAADVATPTDTLARATARPRATVDTAAASDTTARSTTRPRSTAETVAAADSTSATVTRNLVRGTADTAAASDTSSRTTTRARAAGDAAASSDTTLRIRTGPRSTTDAATTSDTSSRIAPPRLRSTTDAATLADSTSASTTGNLARGQAETAAAADTTSRTSTRPRSTTDAAAAADTSTRRVQDARSLGEATSTTDLAAAALHAARAALDALVVLDSSAGAFGLPFVDVRVLAIETRQRRVVVLAHREPAEPYTRPATLRRAVTTRGRRRPTLLPDQEPPT